MNSRAVCSIFLVAAVVAAVPHAIEGANVGRSPCYEVRVEATSYSGYIVGAVQINWSVEVIGEEPATPPEISVYIDGSPDIQASRGIKTIKDTRRYEVGAVKLGARWLSRDALDKKIELVVDQPVRPACSIRMAIDVPEAPDLTSEDISLISQARSEVARSDEEQERVLKSQAGKRELGVALQGAISRELEGSWSDAVLESRPIAKSALFREYVIGLRESWRPSRFDAGPIQTWRRADEMLRDAINDFDRNKEVVLSADDRSFACSLIRSYSGRLAMYGPSAGLEESLALAREICSPFPASMKELDVIQGVAHGRLERNCHHWFEPSDRKAVLQ